MIRIPSWLTERLFDWALYRTQRAVPDVCIGAPGDYSLLRWHVWKRRKWWFNLFIHQMLRSDDDRALHDHPWWSLSLVLTPHLGEVYQWNPPDGNAWFRRFKPGQLVLRSSRFAHRLTVTYGCHAYTLFLVGPNVRQWGFWCPKGWLHNDAFSVLTPFGNMRGKGCE